MPHEVLEQAPITRYLADRIGRALGAKKLNEEEKKKHNQKAGENLDRIQKALGVNQPKLPARKKAVPLPTKPSTGGAPKTTAKPSPITGAVNPVEQIRRGGTPYSPGEGPAQPKKKRRF